MVRVGVVGLGKMGISHLAMINAHPGAKVAAVCDQTSYVLDVLNKYTGVRGYADYNKMLDEAGLDAVILATPSAHHASMVRSALDRGIAVFCEKPFTLDWQESVQLSELAKAKGLANQVGYHYRFVGAFQEVKRLLDAGAIGEVSHVLAEAYGPVVLRTKASTWRTTRTEGGGCLYDYAAHPINLLNWYFGKPDAVGGTRINKIFSKDTDDEVYGTLYFGDAVSAQLSVNWSDESHRKMSTKITIWGSRGKISADRQEVQVYLRDDAVRPSGYSSGWNVRYTTELTQPVWFYLRGEEYSAQLDYFVDAVLQKRGDNVNSFQSGAETDQVIAMLLADSQSGMRTLADGVAPDQPAPARKRFSLFGR